MTVSINDDSPITALGLSTAAPKTLWDAGIQTVGQLLALNRDDLRTIKGMGNARVQDVVTTVAQLGLIFADEEAAVVCDTCGNRRARNRQSIAVDLNGHYTSAAAKNPPCHECDQYHRDLWTRTQQAAA